MAASMKTTKLARTKCSYSVVSFLRREYSETANAQRRKKVPQTIDVDKSDCDLIGPADKASNIRKIKYYIPPGETSLQKELREKREETEEWHHKFWTQHNKSFQQLKDEFTKQKKADKRKLGDMEAEEEPTVSAEEMSEFYKKFLDENYQSHRQYNREWYKKNWHLLWLSLKVNMEKMFSAKRTSRNISDTKQ